jgi:dipeptidase
MKSVERSLPFTELSAEQAAAVNGGHYQRLRYSPCSKPWGAAYETAYRPQSYTAYQPASFRSAARRFDAALFE